MLRLIPAMLLATWLLLTPSQARSNELHDKMRSFAQKIAALCEERNQKQIAMGEFTGPPARGANSGPGLQSMFTAELSKCKIALDDEAPMIVKGEYMGVDGTEDEDALMLRLVLTVRDKKGVRLGEYSGDLPVNKPGTNEETVKMLGLQVDLTKHTKVPPKDANYEIKKQMAKPPLYLDDKKVKTTEEGLFAVEVLVRRKSQKTFAVALPKNKGDKGRAFVDLYEGDVYRIRLYNDTKHESAVTINIDGVDICHFFEPASNRPSSFLVPARGTREIKGWLRSTGKVNEFLVGSYSESAAAKVLKSNAKLGTITVCFHPCWVGKAPPEYAGSRSYQPKGTGLGQEIEQKSKVIERTIGPLLTSIVIRYEK